VVRDVRLWASCQTGKRTNGEVEKTSGRGNRRRTMWEASIDNQFLATYATIDFHRCEYSRSKRQLSKQAGTLNVRMSLFGVFLEFGDFGIAELFLLNLKWLLKQRYHDLGYATAELILSAEREPSDLSASNESSWHVQMRRSVCWERKRVACSTLRAKNLSRG
jgi:hypothetical protein